MNRPANDMIEIPEGPSIMGSNEFSREDPRREVWVPTFWMDRYPVTNSDYLAFATATGRPVPRYWEGATPPEGTEDYPVMVNWHNATAYADWVGKRLPTEEEWEKAASGGDGRRFPWGEEFDPSRALTWESAAISGARGEPARGRPASATPYGCEQMVGLVEEWMLDDYAAYPGSDYVSEGYTQGYKTLRGGGWIFTQTHSRVSYRCFESPDVSDEHFGLLGGPSFRCASTTNPEEN